MEPCQQPLTRENIFSAMFVLLKGGTGVVGEALQTYLGISKNDQFSLVS